MSDSTVPAMAAPPPKRDNPLTRSVAGVVGLIVLGVLVIACVGTLPYTLGKADGAQTPRYAAGSLNAVLLPPHGFGLDEDETERLSKLRDAQQARAEELAQLRSIAQPDEAQQLRLDELERGEQAPDRIFGTDRQGRSVFIRSLTGGGISIGIGIAAATIAVTIGTLYGAIAGYLGGRVDAVMMRIVDVLYGLPYILLVVLLAVAGEALIDEWAFKKQARADWINTEAETELLRRGESEFTKDDVRTLLDSDLEFRAAVDEQLDLAVYRSLAREEGRTAAEARWLNERAPALLVLRDDAVDLEVAAEALESNSSMRQSALRDFNEMYKLQPRNISSGQRTFFEVIVLLVAIGGVSWLTMARVIRGQVLSLRKQPFMEAARAMGVPVHRQFLRHLLPNLLGPIIVYATLTVPQAVLQESFLSFLGIGVKPPLPSWGNMAAEGLTELNTVKVRWWLLLFPCVLLGTTLLALNFVGEGLREAFDPKRARK